MTWVAAGVASGAATMAGVQYIKGKRDQKRDEQNRPKYEIPTEVSQNLDLAKHQALQGLPEEQKQQYLDNLNKSAGYSLNNMTSLKSGLVGLGQVNEQMNQGYQNMLGMDSQARQNNLNQVYAQNQNMANYKDQAYQLNQLNPYYEGIARREARTGALFQNLNNAATMGVGGFMGGQQGGGQQQGRQPDFTGTNGGNMYVSPQDQANVYGAANNFSNAYGNNGGSNYLDKPY